MHNARHWSQLFSGETFQLGKKDVISGSNILKAFQAFSIQMESQESKNGDMQGNQRSFQLYYSLFPCKK
jgi:hypothetical protein